MQHMPIRSETKIHKRRVCKMAKGRIKFGSGELLGYKYPSFRAAARMTPCCSLSFIPAYPDLQDDADHPRCSATG